MARGRPTDSTNINLRKTRGPMRKADLRQSLEGVAAAADAGTPAAKPKRPRRPRDPKGNELLGGSTGSPFLRALLAHGNLTATQKSVVADAWSQPVTINDVAALWTANWLELQKLCRKRKGKGLDPAVAQAAKNQLLTAAVKLAELTAKKGGELPAEVRVVVDLHGAQAGRIEAPPPGPCGDEVPVG